MAELTVEEKRAHRDAVKAEHEKRTSQKRAEAAREASAVVYRRVLRALEDLDSVASADRPLVAGEITRVLDPIRVGTHWDCSRACRDSGGPHDEECRSRDWYELRGVR